MAQTEHHQETSSTNINDVVDIVNDVKAYEAQKFYQKWYFKVILGLFILAIIGVSVIIIVLVISNGNTPPNTEAIQELGDVFEAVINGSNATDYTTELHHVFNAFDDNGDGTWNEAELSTYLQQTCRSDDIFDLMDVNGDDILSYREVTAIFMALDTIPTASTLMQNHFGPLIELVYDYEYNTSDISWFEYAADLYFDFYDAEFTGYISYKSYHDLKAEKFMNILDIDNDNVITFGEFMSDSFNNNTLITEELINIGADELFDKDGFHLWIKNLTLTESDVESLDLTKCPTIRGVTSINNPTAASIRRRLQWAGCVATGSGCAIAVTYMILCLALSWGIAAPACIAPAVITCGVATINCVLTAIGF